MCTVLREQIHNVPASAPPLVVDEKEWPGRELRASAESLVHHPMSGEALGGDQGPIAILILDRGTDGCVPDGQPSGGAMSDLRCLRERGLGKNPRRRQVKVWYIRVASEEGGTP